MTDFEFSKYKVLMCDTDPEVIDIARTTYLDADIGDFVATPSPEEALKHIPKMNPDVILVALKLPNTSGISLIKKIRSMNDGAFYKTPILMLLEKVSQNLLREACRAGIEGALRKPIQPEKIKRFSRAVILKPRRFICVRHYFGPERRSLDDPHFNGKDRRGGLSQDDFSTDTFTRNQKPITPGQSSLDSTPVLSGGFARSSTKNDSTNEDSQNFDWGKSTSKTKSDGGVMDYSSPEFKNTSAAGRSSDQPFDFGTSQDTPASKNTDYDFTSEERPTASEGEIDYGKSSEKQKANAEIKTDTKAKSEPKEKDIDAVKETTTKVKEKALVAIEETGPDSDTFEEVMDLEECLDLHKVWINSGGKSGQQANRPHSDFRGQELNEADFTRAILPQSNFEDVNCTSTVFRKADLRGATFKKALLSSADLRVSRLAKADMREARMDKANLLGADLTGANLEGATLRGVNLSGANLSRTNLRGVNLSSARGLIPEQIKRAITDQGTLLPLNVRTAP